MKVLREVLTLPENSIAFAVGDSFMDTTKRTMTVTISGQSQCARSSCLEELRTSVK